MQKQQSIHTTISPDAYKILERYEQELGRKNVVIEKALRMMDKPRYKARLNIKDSKAGIERVKTGIIGFDDLIEGGIPKGFTIIVTGPPGTGKTTFSMQFLREGVLNKEKCIFFSFEEDAEQLINHFLRFRWDVVKYADEGWLELYGLSMLTTEEIIEILEAYKPKRVVFDSINVFSGSEDFRRSSAWRSLIKLIKREKMICLIITEKKHGLKLIEYDDYDFMGDGIIFLDKQIENNVEISLISVLKMRATNINSIPRPFRFTINGVELYGGHQLEANKWMQEI
ncbi:MAG: RAD55 family ATPase [Methanosarcinales archaeon]